MAPENPNHEIISQQIREVWKAGNDQVAFTEDRSLADLICSIMNVQNTLKPLDDDDIIESNYIKELENFGLTPVYIDATLLDEDGFLSLLSTLRNVMTGQGPAGKRTTLKVILLTKPGMVDNRRNRPGISQSNLIKCVEVTL